MNILYAYTQWIPRYNGDTADSGDSNCVLKAQKKFASFIICYLRYIGESIVGLWYGYKQWGITLKKLITKS